MCINSTEQIDVWHIEGNSCHLRYGCIIDMYSYLLYVLLWDKRNDKLYTYTLHFILIALSVTVDI